MSRMRIVGGTFKGRPLSAPAGRDTRPTSERVREAVFNILLHGVEGFSLDGARVLDVFAGGLGVCGRFCRNGRLGP